MGHLVAANHERGVGLAHRAATARAFARAKRWARRAGAFLVDRGFVDLAVAGFEGGAEALEDLRTVRGSGGQHENRSTGPIPEFLPESSKA